MSVIIAGSLNMDLVIRVDEFPSAGETIRGSSFDLIPGGKGLNQAVAAARSGAKTFMSGAVGNDDNGTALLKLIEAEKIDATHVKILDTTSGVALVEVNSKGENRIVIVAGANSQYRYTIDLDAFFSSHSDGILIGPLENEIMELERIYIAAKKNGLKTILNPAPVAKLNEEFLSSIDILIPNQHEAAFLSDIHIEDLDSAKLAAEKLLLKHHEAVIITLGQNGSLYYDRSHFIHQEAFTVNALDTTGAGDTFCGAFAAALDSKLPIKVALRFASAAASISTTRSGASASIPRISEVQALLNSVTQ